MYIVCQQILFQYSMVNFIKNKTNHIYLFFLDSFSAVTWSCCLRDLVWFKLHLPRYLLFFVPVLFSIRKLLHIIPSNFFNAVNRAASHSFKIVIRVACCCWENCPSSCSQSMTYFLFVHRLIFHSTVFVASALFYIFLFYLVQHKYFLDKLILIFLLIAWTKADRHKKK